MLSLQRSGLSAVLGVTAAALALTAVTAPPASAAGAASCTYNISDHNAEVDGNGVNYRTGPSTAYASKGFLYTGDDLRVYCGNGSWYYTKLTARSKSGLPAGTYGWIRSDMLLSLAG
ncbi:SH3 domain-containing protein [Streptomyces sp. NRRL S-146]|uniref:SH3 domain-containing protein n=1 Tax=Streptomyces sp. NRRL S-146 TaxID=1463884 RepID=UPI000ACDD5D3|nr:SH3 domain-containing protein [Streptomyces sp. NRRL S-146]